MKTVKTEKAPAAIGPYAQAIQSNGFLFTSGQIPLRVDGSLVDGDVIEQTKQVLENLKAVLEDCSLSFSHVVKTTVFLADMNDFSDMNKVYAEFFSTHTPARSTVQVARLPRDVKVEIELIATTNK